mgnify:CR=1 FL=1
MELASAAQEQMEHRAARAEARIKSERTPMTAEEASGINDAIDAAIRYFAHFLRCYKDARLDGAPIGRDNEAMAPLTAATELDEGSVEAYLTSHFSVARLLTRRVAMTPVSRLESLRTALSRFEWVVKHGPALVPPSAPAGFFEAEFRMAAEMARLLPERLRLGVGRAGDSTAVGAGSAASRSSGAKGGGSAGR